MHVPLVAPVVLKRIPASHGHQPWENRDPPVPPRRARRGRPGSAPPPALRAYSNRPGSPRGSPRVPPVLRRRAGRGRGQQRRHPDPGPAARKEDTPGHDQAQRTGRRFVPLEVRYPAARAARRRVSTSGRAILLKARRSAERYRPLSGKMHRSASTSSHAA